MITTRISGLGSGMDIDSMIKSLMTAENSAQQNESEQNYSKLAKGAL
jgi:flagellar capping protein FliD